MGTKKERKWKRITLMLHQPGKKPVPLFEAPGIKLVALPKELNFSDWVPPDDEDKVESAIKTEVLKRLAMRSTAIDGNEVVFEYSGPSGVEIFDADRARQMPFIEKAARLNETILITGPSGSGKEGLARLIHGISPRRKMKFFPVNCGGINDETLISEIFGHVKGAFTGAYSDKQGAVALAEGGTLFLDEVGDMPPLSQAKLLRFLNDGFYQRMGDPEEKRSDVRIICATNKDLPQMIREKKFREDLYYRINVFPVSLNGLTIKKIVDVEHPERRFDEWFRNYAVKYGHVEHIKQYGHVEDKKFYGFQLPKMTAAALKVLVRYNFPGNWRELDSILKYAYVKCDGKSIKRDDLPSYVLNSNPEKKGDDLSSLPPEEFRKEISRIIYSRLESEQLIKGSIHSAAKSFGMDDGKFKRRLHDAQRGHAI